jgi:hypothetical protein
MMISLNEEQKKAYDRFIKARDIIYKRKNNWVRAGDIKTTVDIVGLNHPLYEANLEYEEYKEAFKQWLEIEPAFRDAERMRSTRGDYGAVDSWDEKPSKIKEL